MPTSTEQRLVEILELLADVGERLRDVVVVALERRDPRGRQCRRRGFVRGRVLLAPRERLGLAVGNRSG